MRFSSIQLAYAKHKQGLTVLDVSDLINNSRKLLTNKAELFNFPLLQSATHFKQANHMTFGSKGPGFQYIDPDLESSNEYIDQL